MKEKNNFKYINKTTNQFLKNRFFFLLLGALLSLFPLFVLLLNRDMYGVKLPSIWEVALYSVYLLFNLIFGLLHLRLLEEIRLFLPTSYGIATLVYGSVFGYIIAKAYSWRTAIRSGLPVALSVGILHGLVGTTFFLGIIGAPFAAISFIGIFIGSMTAKAFKHLQSRQ